MNSSPFSSKTYTNTWLKHFHLKGHEISFSFLNGTSFYKYPLFPIYINVGRNLTKGITYTLETEEITGVIKNKVLLIYDVPDYFTINHGLPNRKFTIARITQYPGFLIDLKLFTDLNNFMVETFSKSSRYKLNKFKKKLESCFNIKYKMFYGQISEREYNTIFDQFENLLRKRFLQKETTNNNLDPKEWTFYKEVTYPMILENNAALFVTYNGDQIIAVTLNYIHNNTLIDAITVFDIDYSKFSLGSVNILKLIEWCLENKFDKLDFSKGYFDYKKRWCNLEYKFDYHLIYNKKALLPKAIAFTIKKYFIAKQFLRDKKLNERFHEFYFLVKNRSIKKNIPLGFNLQELSKPYTEFQLKEISILESRNDYLKKALFEYLYINNESISNIRVYKILNSEKTYIFQGRDVTTKVQLER
ncbi:GNAT family N-acetyltransferase [Arenibacter sp. BSSL-BM3]|uniref:GNAT family N-acetyltransferase n=1 Tax=Arenibacter arenosicollis TaxID=2762274 RepID=A0ABR7QKY3_9FLAO|nr:GNAT family N-acetyltransferase [Arenibacter arenosicollis]MBC8767856.1 GNAT family N-acetyltransferase [Arenibacter arenosicollis]